MVSHIAFVSDRNGGQKNIFCAGYFVRPDSTTDTPELFGRQAGMDAGRAFDHLPGAAIEEEPAKCAASPRKWRSGTPEAANAVRAPDLGHIGAGKLADLLLLEANPLEDIRSTQRIWRVIRGG